MYGLFALVWFVTLIAFIVFWRKKINAKKNLALILQNIHRCLKLKD